MKWLHMVSFILLIAGGLNWLLVAFDFNAVALLGETVAQIVYILVGLAAVYEVITHKSNCRACDADGMGM